MARDSMIEEIFHAFGQEEYSSFWLLRYIRGREDTCIMVTGIDYDQITERSNVRISIVSPGGHYFDLEARATKDGVKFKHSRSKGWAKAANWPAVAKHIERRIYTFHDAADETILRILNNLGKLDLQKEFVFPV